MVWNTGGVRYRWCMVHVVWDANGRCTDGTGHRWCRTQVVLNRDGADHQCGKGQIWRGILVVHSTGGVVHRWCTAQIWWGTGGVGLR